MNVDDIKTMLPKYKVGDKVRCIGETNGSASGTHSAGWKKGLEFIVDHTTSWNEYTVYWPVGGGNGVFEEHLKLVIDDVEEMLKMLREEVEREEKHGKVEKKEVPAEKVAAKPSDS